MKNQFRNDMLSALLRWRDMVRGEVLLVIGSRRLARADTFGGDKYNSQYRVYLNIKRVPFFKKIRSLSHTPRYIRNREIYNFFLLSKVQHCLIIVTA